MSEKDHLEDDEEIQRRIDEIVESVEKKNKKEIALALGKGMVAAIPYAGGLISEIAGVWAPDYRFKRGMEFVRKLAYDLEKLRSK